jgi:hypothetical protein
MPTIRFTYSIAMPAGGGNGMQRHGLTHDMDLPHISHTTLQAAERRFTTWFAAEHTQARLLRWQCGPTDGGIHSVYECRLPAFDDETPGG